MGQNAGLFFGNDMLMQRKTSRTGNRCGASCRSQRRKKNRNDLVYWMIERNRYIVDVITEGLRTQVEVDNLVVLCLHFWPLMHNLSTVWRRVSCSLAVAVRSSLVVPAVARTADSDRG